MVDRIVAAVFLLLTLGYGYVGSTYQAQFSYEPIGPRAFPLLLAGIAAACWLWLALRPESVAEDLEGLAKGVLPKAVILIVGLFAYAFLFEPLGFPLSTALATILIGRFFGGTWAKLVIAGALLGVSLYVLFDRLLDVTLPLGKVFGG
jgi:putative tricarboxylic transport membrane protein